MLFMLLQLCYICIHENWSKPSLRDGLYSSNIITCINRVTLMLVLDEWLFFGPAMLVCYQLPRPSQKGEKWVRYWPKYNDAMWLGSRDRRVSFQWWIICGWQLNCSSPSLTPAMHERHKRWVYYEVLYKYKLVYLLFLCDSGALITELRK